MKCLADYTPATPAAELYHCLAELIVAKRVTSFAGLLDISKDLPADQKTAVVYRRLFLMIRRLYWGFFSDISPAAYPKIWKSVVIEHPDFPECGDLKRNLTISDVFVGILDLHGYTRFCEKNKHNLSMLQMLDDLIQTDVVNIAKEHNVVLQRRQGDTMVLVGASAVDMVTVALLIIGHFSKRRQIDLSTQTAHRAGYKIILDDMTVSAGIAGGKKFTPFIITRDGDLSGGVVNTAARLQSRANELSGNQSRIIVSRSVATSYGTEIRQRQPVGLKSMDIAFCDSGWISFKGISVAVNEVIYTADERYRLDYESDLVDFLKAVKANNWKDGLFCSLLTLLIAIYEKIPTFGVQTVSNGLTVNLGNADFIRCCQTALTEFRQRQHYREAIAALDEVVEMTRRISGFDKLVLEYCDLIIAKYRELADVYAKLFTEKIAEKAMTNLPTKYRQLYAESQKAVRINERLQHHVETSLTPLDLSLLWSGVVDSRLHDLDITIYSGKH